jgi:HEAT repeat protein
MFLSGQECDVRFGIAVVHLQIKPEIFVQGKRWLAEGASPIYRSRVTLRQRIIIYAVVLGGFGVLVTLPFLPAHKARYHGRTLEEWRGDLSSEKPVETRRHAEEVLLQVGTNLAPQLMKRLNQEDSRLTQTLVAIFQKQRLIESPFTTEQMRYNEVCYTMYELGPGARAVIPGLAAMAEDAIGKDPRRGREAFGVIRAAGQEAIDPLMRLAVHSNAGMRGAAMWSLGEIYSELRQRPPFDVPDSRRTEQVVQMLLNRLNDTDKMTRLMAINALGGVGDAGRSSSRIVPALIGIVIDTNALYRTRAAWHLRNFKNAGLDEVAPLLGRATDPDTNVSQPAVLALGQLASQPDAVVPVLAGLLRQTNSNPAIRVTALEALAEFGPRAKAALPEIRKARMDPDPIIRRNATNADLRIDR